MHSPGIHWNGRTYSRLSGPISLSYLHPPANQPELPLVLLLGDKHGTNRPCDPCDASSGCLSVLRDEFFHDLDELAKEYPVDVFTETEWEHQPKGNESETLFHHFVSRTQTCYDVAKRSHVSAPCPTQFVRWHHVDTRLMNPKNYAEGRIGNLLVFLRHLYDMSQTKPFRFNYPTYSSVIVPSDEVGYIVDVLALLFHTQRNERDMSAEVIELLFSFLDTRPSMIRKEMEKQHLLEKKTLHAALVDALFTSEAYTDAIGGMVAATHADPKLMAVFQDILLGVFQTERFVYSYPHDKRTTYLEKNIDVINYIIECVYHVFLFTTSALLDVYALARMLKKPQGNDRGILHLGYYGFRHCEVIHHLLVSLFHYSVQASYSASRDHSCIEFEHPLRIEHDMENLASERYLRHPEQRKEYQNTLARESQGRISHAEGGRRRQQPTRRKRGYKGKGKGKGTRRM